MRILRQACLLTAAACYNEAPTPPPEPGVEQPITTQLALRDDVRQLWAQRAFWSRNYVVDVLGELPSRDASLQRLMENQVALGEAVKPFYGDAAGNQLTALLQENIALSAELLIATRDGDKGSSQTLTSQLAESTARLADFFADQNPYVSRGELQLQLQGYDDTNALQVNERLVENWEADLAAADASMRQALTVADALASALAAQFPAKVSQSSGTNVTTLHTELRALWMDHVSWQRMFFVSDLSALPDVTAVANRLMQNQIDLGNALKPFYGNPAGTQLANLLTQHVALATGVLRAASSNDEEALSVATSRWQANADAIGSYLASANPHLDEAVMQTLMRAHVDQLVVEVRARLAGDYAGEVAAHDVVEHHVFVISDELSRAIGQQFEGNFKPEG
jgi:hypothetical protein